MIGEQQFRTEVGDNILKLVALIDTLKAALQDTNERIDRLEAHVEERTAVRRRRNIDPQDPTKGEQ